MPPSPFKIFLYFLEADSFVESGIYEKYAFDSYYTVEIEECDIRSGGEVTAYKSYDYTWEAISLAVRIILTIIIELLIGIIFGFSEKRELIFLAGINSVTQIGLNIVLNLVNYKSGNMLFSFFYVILEILIFIIEAVLYVEFMPKISQRKIKRGKAVLYAFTANAASFILGMWLSHLIPGIF